MQMRAPISALAALFATVLCSACAAVHRPPTTLAQLERDAVTAARAERDLRDSVMARLVRRAALRTDKTIDVLMLSGGGQNGAFGAGFLRGWRERTDTPLPTFDLVTGISTGALQAPYALLGTPAALDTLGVLYRNAADRVAPTVDWWFPIRRTGGVVNTKRYDRALEQSITGRFAMTCARHLRPNARSSLRPPTWTLPPDARIHSPMRWTPRPQADARASAAQGGDGDSRHLPAGACRRARALGRRGDHQRAAVVVVQ
jgi:hypothetical protein